MVAYNDGWRVYEDTPVSVEKKHMLLVLKNQYSKQLEKQKDKVRKESEKCREIDPFKNTKARVTKARMKLQEECEVRDNIERRIRIIEEWIEELEKSR